MKEYTVTVRASVVITVADDEALARVDEEEFRRAIGNYTRASALEHFAYNAVVNGERDASVLDGWADLPYRTVTMSVEEVEMEADSWA